MLKKITIGFLSLFLVSSAFTQNEEKVLMTINDREITLGEFERIYKKNSNIKESEFDQKSVEDYLDLFINFKLKVMEAEALGYDTLESFTQELAGYRRQLEKPYLTDNEVDEKLMKEAYERMQYDVRASHILLRLDEKALPEDTAIVVEKIKEIRQKIINGVPFGEAAKQLSEDPSAKQNFGDLGFFTVFQMVYPFESAAFNTEVGEISEPVRTKFGYHLVQVTDKRKAIGKVKVAHIMVAVPSNMDEGQRLEAEQKVAAIYDSIQAGADFAELAARHSDDKGSAARGGELPMFGTGRMVPEFEKVAFELSEVNQVAKPIKTSFGYHIVKLLHKEPIGSYEDLKQEIKSKVSRDSRLVVSKRAILSQLRNEYNYRTVPENIKNLSAKLDDRLFTTDKWLEENEQNLQKPVFYLLDSVYTQYDYAAFIKKKARKSKEESYSMFVHWTFPGFVDDMVEKFERGRLEIKYPEFKYLMQEYHDGILLFELTDKVVWSKAVQDTIGLSEFHEKNKDNYMWGERYDGTLYICKDEKIFSKANKLFTKGKTADEVIATINKKDDSNIIVEKGLYSKGDNSLIDFVVWEKGKEENVKDQLNTTIIKGNTIPPQQKTLEEAKGLITADYQTYLEQEWIKELREKYTIKVNEDILGLIK